MSAQNNMLVKLGFSPDTKLLIIHNDDLGLSHGENMASIAAFENGSVNSGSVMVNCAWFGEIAKYCTENPALDIGVHLTLTSEWPNYKWGPVLPINEVPSLTDPFGFFYGGDFHEYAKVADVVKELEAQVERAILFGIQTSHLDCHMFALYAKREYLEAYIHLGRAYQLPILLSTALAGYFGHDLTDLITEEDLLVDSIFIATPESFEAGLAQSYQKVMEDLSPGIHVMLIHTAFDGEEMRGITSNYPDWGAKWREEDFSFFTSDTCKKVIEENNLHLITWKELNERFRRSRK